MQRESAQQKAAQKVTIIGALVNLILGVLKVLFGMLSHSAGLVADGIHSISDLITDLMVIVILKISGKGPDENHPWGHARFETVGTVILGSILIAVAGAMAYDSALRLLADDPLPTPEWPALAVAAVSILAKEWIFRYTLRIGKQVDSDLLIANAWHSRTDSLSSIVVVIGILGAMLGLLWLDALAAIVVAVMIAKVGWDLSWKSLIQLVDTSLPASMVKRYREVVTSVEGIVDVHSFKTRSMGSKNILEMHIQVTPNISASEGHQIGDTAANRLMKQEDDIGHIIFHIDTYNDETSDAAGFNAQLPLRSDITPLIDQQFQLLTGAVPPYELTLYYTGEQINLLILINTETEAELVAGDCQKLAEQFHHSLQGAIPLGKLAVAAGASHG